MKTMDRPLQHLAAARRINPAGVTRILSQCAHHLENGWPVQEAHQVRDNALRVIVVTGR
jgi:hypothetical protein